MNIKNFIIGGVVGGIVNFLLGGLFYGFLFSSQFPGEENMSMGLVIAGCLAFGFLLSFVFTKWAGISTLRSGLSAGAIMGLYVTLYSNFFRMAGDGMTLSQFWLDGALGVVMGGIVGAIVGFTLGKLKND